MGWSKKKKAAAGVTAGLALIIGIGVAIGSGSETEAEPPAAVQTTPAPAPAETTPAPDPAPAPEEEVVAPAPESNEPQFGETYTWDNGLSVKISQPRVFQPDRWAVGAEGPGTSVRFTITVTNGTDSRQDLSMDIITVQSGDTEAEQIYADGLDGSPSTTLLPGRTSTYDVGFHVKNVNDLVVEYQPGDWDLDSAIFTS